MIKIQYFAHQDTDAFNEFMLTHPPRATKDSGGITIAPGGLFVTYDDDPLSPPEQIAWLTDQVRLKRTEILNGEPDLRKKTIEKPLIEDEIQVLKKEIDGRDESNKTVEYRDEMNQKEKDLEFKEAVLHEMENFIMMSEKNKEDSAKKIKVLLEMIQDVKDGKFVMP